MTRKKGPDKKKQKGNNKGDNKEGTGKRIE